MQVANTSSKETLQKLGRPTWVTGRRLGVTPGASGTRRDSRMLASDPLASVIAAKKLGEMQERVQNGGAAKFDGTREAQILGLDSPT